MAPAMGISLKAQHVKRYSAIAWLLMKYGRSDLVQKAGLEGALEGEQRGSGVTSGHAEELAADLERMGPTYVKLGQLLSSRPDLLAPEYMEALTRLQDHCEPFSFAEVERIVTEELGVRISKAFAEFDSTPLAAASLGQVHRATMRDGRQVAVKVQRPGIRAQILEDLEALDDIARFVDSQTEAGRHFEFARMLAEFRKSLLRELDYKVEAQNLLTMASIVEDFEHIVVPSPVEDYTTGRVLTMEYIKGRKITDVSPLARLELNGGELADELFAAYLKQILVDGFFHADPHPGNVFLTDDGRIALLDLGMVARIAPRLQETLLQLLLAVSEGRADDAVAMGLRIGEKTDLFDEREFSSRVSDIVARHQSTTLRQIEVGKMVLEMTKVSSDCGVRLPPELTMLGKTLLNLDQVAWTLDPDFDPNAAINRHASEVVRKNMLRSASPGNIIGSMLEGKEFLERLPGRANKILEKVAENQLEIKVNAIDETKLMTGFQKVANRITTGLILSALIVGAALLMRVQTSFTLLGYPGLAIIFFMIAAAGGSALVLSILRDD